MKQLNRWVYAIVGVIVLLFAGLVYAWSVLSTPIGAEFTGWTKAQLSLTFTLVMILFCIGSLLCGLLAGKLSAKTPCAWARSCFWPAFHRQPLPVAADAVPGLRRAVRPGLRPELQRRDEHHGPLVPGSARPDLRRAADGLRRRQLSDRQAVPGLDTCRRRRLAHQLSGAGHRMLCGAGGVLLLFVAPGADFTAPAVKGGKTVSRPAAADVTPGQMLKKPPSGCTTSGPSRSALPDWP